MEIIGSFLKDLRGWWKKIFWKKGKLFREEKFLAYFSPNNDCNKSQGTIKKGPMGSLIISVDDVKSFLRNIVCWKQKILKKRRQSFHWRRDFGLLFPAISSVTNLVWQFKRVHEVFWQLLWQLQDHFRNT